MYATAHARCFHEGFVPQMATAELLAREAGLLADDAHLLQGATTSPPPIVSCLDWPLLACCPVTYGAWRSRPLTTVADAEELFAQRCFEADNLLGEEAGCRHLLNWLDDSGRQEMRHQLLAEVRLALASRNPTAA
jgi:hypothetical protein